MINKCHALQKQPHRNIMNKTHGKQIFLAQFYCETCKNTKTAPMLDPCDSQNVRLGNLAQFPSFTEDSGVTKMLKKKM